MPGAGPGGSDNVIGSKFVVNFTIEGDGEKSLKGIAAGFKNLQTGAEKAGEQYSHSFMNAHAAMQLVERGTDAISEAGTGLIEVGVGIFEAWGHGFEKLLESGSEFEQMLIRIQATGKTPAEAQQMMKDTVAFTKELPLTERDALRLMQSISMAKIDALKPIGETYEELAKKGKTIPGLSDMMGIDKFKKEAPNAVTLTADVLAAAGQLGPGQIGMASHELAILMETGKLATRIRFGALTDDLRKVGRAAGGAAGRYAALKKVLEDRGALGAAQASMHSIAGILTNFKGLYDSFIIAVMEPGKKGGITDKFVEGFIKLYNIVGKFFDDRTPQGKKFTDGLKLILHFVSDLIIPAMEKLGKAVEFVFDFISENSGLIALAAGFSLLAGALSIVAGIGLVAAAALTGLFVVVLLFPPILLSIPIAIAAIVAGFMTLGATLAGGLAVYETWQNNLGGIKDKMDDVNTVLTALWQTWKNLTDEGSHIDEDLAEKLQKRGLLGYFQKGVVAIVSIHEAWKSFSKGFTDKWNEIKANVMDNMSQSFENIKNTGLAVIQTFFDVMGMGSDTVENASNKGEMWGNKMASLADKLSAKFKEITMPGNLISQFTDLYKTFLQIESTLKLIVGLIEIGIGSALTTLAVMVAPVLVPFMALYYFISAIGVAIQALINTDFKFFAHGMSSIADDIKSNVQTALTGIQMMGKGAQNVGEAAGELAGGNEQKRVDLSNRIVAGLDAVNLQNQGVGVPQGRAFSIPEEVLRNQSKKEETPNIPKDARSQGGWRTPLVLNATMVVDNKAIGKVTANYNMEEESRSGGLGEQLYTPVGGM